MIVLDEHHVKQAEAMIAAATTRNGIFFQPPPPRRRFAGIEDLRSRVLDRVNELSGQSRHAGKALEKVQSDPFGTEHGAGGALDLQQNSSCLRALAVLGGTSYFQLRRQF